MEQTSREITGRYQAAGKGYGFLIPDGGGEDYFLPPGAEGGAWHNDLVSALPDARPPEEGRRTASVTGVLTRGNRTVTGVLYRRGHEVWLTPDNDRLPSSIRVVGRRAGVRGGDRAALTITSFGGRGAKPMGVLAEVFGRTGNRDARSAAILYNYGIRPDFPPEVLSAADRVPRAIPPEALRGRTDLRQSLVITIDGASAKDLDDAVSLERDEAGRPVLGVHIADVSHYVPFGSPLDVEAWTRGTSVYYADKVVPMLPPALSNGICSLNPAEDRLTLSCFMVLDEQGAVLEHKIVKSVIRSTHRMTYEDCNVLLAGGSSALAERYADILPLLRNLADLAAVLIKKRRLRGALTLETREVAVRCDASGAPVGAEIRTQGVSESLIEECMLCANETVAEHLFTLQKPAVYRVHEKPSADKTEALRTLLEPLGYSLLDADNFSLQKVLAQAEGKPEAGLIHMLVLRSLMKARYESENLGHFGLAAKYYCHFTSPIRRYPDLMVHRILTALLEGRPEKKLASAVKKAALQSSERELAAANAEREIEKCYLAEYMKGHVGGRFHGMVSGVARFGLFVTLDSGVEGFVPAAALPNDEYAYDEARLTLTGLRTKTRFSFGMPLDVVCAAADPDSGQIDFRLAFPDEKE